jgi:RHS repeat-associated protein
VTSKASSVFSNPANGTWGYTYDGASRLVQATGPNASGAATTYDYAYDGAGNRIVDKETTGAVVRNLTTTYDAAGLPTSASDTATGESLTYAHDEVGNLTGIDSSIGTNDWTYAYDPYARLTCAVQGSSCASGSSRVLYTMDALDRALTRTKGSSVTSLTYRGIAESLVKKVEGTTTTTYASTAGGAPLAEQTGSTASFYLRDPHGDVVGLASTAAADQGSASFDPWGRNLASTGQSSFLGYQGDMTDPDTKQVDMGTRWYAAGLGRFTARDVLFGKFSSPKSLNQHVYGGLNPITMWDPTGMGECSMVGECITTTASGVVQAVGGNPGAANHPMHDRSSSIHSGSSVDAGSTVDVTPRPPRPDPMVRDADFVSAVPAIDFPADDIPMSCGKGSCGIGTSVNSEGDGGCGVLWLGCAWGGLKVAGRFAWQHKNMIATAACISPLVWVCVGAVGVAFIGNEIDYANATPGPWRQNLTSGEGIKYAAGNALLSLATVAIPNGTRVGASALRGNFMVPRGLPATSQVIVNAPGAYVNCVFDEVCPAP